MQKTTYEAKRAEKVVEEMRKMKTRPLITTKSPAKTPAALNTTFQKVQKLKKIDEKADQAKRAREDLLREKADSAKREREEREKRVEQNNRKKEEARLERENLNEKNIWRLLKNFKIKPHLLLNFLQNFMQKSVATTNFLHPRVVHCSRRNLATAKAAVDQILRANERTIIFSGDEQQAIARVDVGQVSANKPIEDFYSASKCLNSNAFLLGVFDGHGGATCARHVCTRLYDYICCSVLDKHRVVHMPIGEQLQWLFGSATPSLPADIDQVHQLNIREYFKRIKKKSNCPLTTVRDTLQTSFSVLDEDLAKSAMPDQNGLVCRMSVNAAVSGSCALVSHIRRNNLHVASCGDSAAVLGVHLANDVIARQLTRPHTVENLDEIARIRSAHPPSENRTILKANRLLGELYPLRAFGDVRFKWPKELQKVVLDPLGMPAPQHLLTPPYLTCLPEVFYHQLTSNDRFLVLATDGLWEFLDSDAVVRLVEDHMTGHSTLNVFRPEHKQPLGDILNNLEKRQSADNKKPLDENCATHLIRNALGGVSGDVELQYARLEEMLMLPPGMARHYRDDITVVVIQFNEKYLLEDHEDDGGHF